MPLGRSSLHSHAPWLSSGGLSSKDGPPIRRSHPGSSRRRPHRWRRARGFRRHGDRPRQAGSHRGESRPTGPHRLGVPRGASSGPEADPASCSRSRIACPRLQSTPLVTGTSSKGDMRRFRHTAQTTSSPSSQHRRQSASPQPPQPPTSPTLPRAGGSSPSPRSCSWSPPRSPGQAVVRADGGRAREDGQLPLPLRGPPNFVSLRLARARRSNTLVNDSRVAGLCGGSRKTLWISRGLQPLVFSVRAGVTGWRTNPASADR